MLHVAELTWNGGKGEYQAAIRRKGRATLGVFQSTLLGIVAAESGLTPARALLDPRQARLTQRLLARPRGQGSRQGPEEILIRDFALTDRLRVSTFLWARETEEQL